MILQGCHTSHKRTYDPHRRQSGLTTTSRLPVNQTSSRFSQLVGNVPGTISGVRAYIANVKSRIALLLCSLCILIAPNVGYASDLVLVGGKIYSSPTEPPIENGSILVHDGRILTVRSSATIKIPRDAKVIDCKGLVITAGFWNNHVHILTPGLLHAEKLSSEQITSQLEEMLTRWGFTTVFDLNPVTLETQQLLPQMP
jgi:hypothetical protein